MLLIPYINRTQLHSRQFGYLETSRKLLNARVQIEAIVSACARALTGGCEVYATLHCSLGQERTTYKANARLWYLCMRSQRTAFESCACVIYNARYVTHASPCMRSQRTVLTHASLNVHALLTHALY